MQIVETRTAKIFIDENNILQILLHRNSVVDYEDALDNALVIKRLTKGGACFKLVDIRYHVKFEIKAKKFIDSKDVQATTLARAVLINNSVKRVTFNFFIQFNSVQIPTRFFTKKDEAIKWLKTFQGSNNLIAL